MRVRGRWAIACGAAALMLAGCGGGVVADSHRLAPTTVGSGATTVQPPSSAAGRSTRPYFAQSATFVSPETGWVLGTTSCASHPSLGANCLVLLHTEDSGRTWTPLGAPQIPDPVLAEVRFADPEDGWIFDRAPGQNAVWETHDGGAHWALAPLISLSSDFGVFDLEAADGLVQAVFSGLPVTIESSPVRADHWTAASTTLQLGAGPVPNAQLVLQGATGWVLENDRVVVSGARLVGGAWQPWSPPCTGVGGMAVLAASDPTHVVALCSEGVWGPGPEHVVLGLSDDGGTTFRLVPTDLPVDSAGPVATPASGVVFVATPDGRIVATFDGGATWSTRFTGGGNGQWRQLGFTTSSQGVAITDGGTLLITFDGGHTWSPVVFSGVAAG